MFPKEIQNIINSYYQSYFVYELNQDFLSSYEWGEICNCGRWKKNGRLINFCQIVRNVRNINSTTWKNCHRPSTLIGSFVKDRHTNYSIPSRYYTTLIESDLSESEKARTLIKRGV